LVHPVEHIRGSVSNYLFNKCIILGITGSVAAYRAIDTARWLIRRGARVVPVLTKVSSELLGRALLKWATGEEPIENLTGDTEHIDLAESCDVMVVAPATLSTISKIANGIADNPVALTAISIMGMKKPVVVVPTMHYNMLSTLQYESSIATLKRMDVTIIPPKVIEDVAKYPDPALVGRIVATLALRKKDLDGLKVIVTAGASREWLDPVRFISNPSSGKMGLELALEAYARGAEVYFLHGSLSFESPHIFKNYYCESTEDFANMLESLTDRERFDVIISAAALADFKPEVTWDRKIKSGSEINIKLLPTSKALLSIKKRPRILVGFAAETLKTYEELELKARKKIEKYNLDVIVANFVGKETSGFGSDYIEGLIGFKGRKVSRRLKRMLKEEASRIIIDEIVKLLHGE